MRTTFVLTASAMRVRLHLNGLDRPTQEEFIMLKSWPLMEKYWKIAFLQEGFAVSGLVHAAPVFTTVPPKKAARTPNIQRFSTQGAISYPAI